MCHIVPCSLSLGGEDLECDNEVLLEVLPCIFVLACELTLTILLEKSNSHAAKTNGQSQTRTRPYLGRLTLAWLVVSFGQSGEEPVLVWELFMNYHDRDMSRNAQRRFCGLRNEARSFIGDSLQIQWVQHLLICFVSSVVLTVGSSVRRRIQQDKMSANDMVV